MQLLLLASPRSAVVHVQALWEFVAEVVILHHSTTLCRGYAPIMHIGVVTQAASIVDITVRPRVVPVACARARSHRCRAAVPTCPQPQSRCVAVQSMEGERLEALRTGDRAILRCRFMYQPELVAPGAVLLFREGRAKGVGRVNEVVRP
jgi:GTPase